MNEIVRTGGCACGGLRFEARGEPHRVGLCHCLVCRKYHAAPFNAFAMFPGDRVTFTGRSIVRRYSGNRSGRQLTEP